MVALRRMFAAASLIAAMCWPEDGFAQAAANFYQGKQITMLVAGPAGGGYDTYARTLARHMGRRVFPPSGLSCCARHSMRRLGMRNSSPRRSGFKWRSIR